MEQTLTNKKRIISDLPQTVLHDALCISVSESVFHVIKKMSSKNCTLVCATDEYGYFVGILTTRMLGEFFFPYDLMMQTPVFCNALFAINKKPIRQLIQQTNIQVRQTETLAETVKQMVMQNVDEVPVIDQKGFPRWTVSMQDILNYYCELGESIK